MNYFLELERDRLYKAHTITNYTRSAASLLDIHSAIADYIKDHSSYAIQDMRTHEYVFTNSKGMGSKKVDIALLDNDGKLKGAILFKGVCKDYNKNANNYYESMKGESSLFIEDNIPVYQMMWLPSYLPSSNSTGWETPSINHIENYDSFIINKSSYWDALQIDIFFFDIDYRNNYQINYSNKLKLKNSNKTIEEGLEKFIQEVDRHWTK